MTAYYNEWEAYPAQWLRNLIKAGLIASGDVDERSIKDVKADDLKGYTQCHFFAGIGGWSYALRLAGWDDDRRVWTGSCPCQPFSPAGKQDGKKDARHLWPTWFSLIKEYKPAIVLGEQVKQAITHGWLDDVYQGLEGEGYAFGSAVLPACAGGRGHRRERIFFVGDTQYDGQSATAQQGSNGTAIQQSAKGQNDPGQFAGTGDIQTLADATGKRQSGSWPMGESLHPAQGSNGQTDKSVDAGAGLSWLGCPDGYARNIEPTIPVLAYGVSPDMASVCASGFGNAIVPRVAAEFISSYMECRP